MNATPPVRVERRVGQRFPFLLPLAVRHVATGAEGQGFSQDLSSRGVFFVTDMALEEGGEVEITLRMPSEITLGESMPVRCRGRVLRVAKPSASEGTSATGAQAKIGVAVRLDGYEYLNEPREASRISALHSQHDGDEDSHADRRGNADRPVVQVSARF